MSPNADHEDDLKLAVRLGFFIKHEHGLQEGVTISGRLLCWDPGLPPARRAQLVCAALAHAFRNSTALACCA